jgi:hypothetical protein
MSVVIEEVIGRLEPAAGSVTCGPCAEAAAAAAPRKPQDLPLKTLLRKLERRRLRLEAD